MSLLKSLGIEKERWQETSEGLQANSLPSEIGLSESMFQELQSTKLFRKSTSSY